MEHRKLRYEELMVCIFMSKGEAEGEHVLTGVRAGCMNRKK
jgi:hypothetical protein